MHNQSLNMTKNFNGGHNKALISWICFKLTIVLFGVMGNLLVCRAMCRRLKIQQHNNVNIFYLSLAVADLGVLLVVFPIHSVVWFMPDRWPLGEIFCKTVYPFGDTFYGSSVWSITAIALDRYLNIVTKKGILNKNDSGPSTRRNASIIVIFVWLVSFLFVALPAHIMMDYTISQNGKISCRIHWERYEQFKISFQLEAAVFSYFLPLAIIIWAYVKIWREVQKSTQSHMNMRLLEGPSSSSHRDSILDRELEQKLKHNARVKRVLTPVVIAFAFTMFPITLYRILLVGSTDMMMNLEIGKTLFHIIDVFTLANSSVNPVIYSMVSKELRRELFAMKCRNTQQLQKRQSILSSSRKSNSKTRFSLVGEWPPAVQLRETNV